VLAIVAPGQGAQVPGFLAPWLDLPNVRGRLQWLSACAGMDLAHYGTEADADTIRDTAVAQPLIVAAGLLPLLELFPHPAEAFGMVGVGAGHSVGELTVAAAAHVISAEQAMVLVRERGRAMAEAAAVTPTGMTAVLGGDRDTVVAKLAEHDLVAANENGAGQIVNVATGYPERVERVVTEIERRLGTTARREIVDKPGAVRTVISTARLRAIMPEWDELGFGSSYLPSLLDRYVGPVSVKDDAVVSGA